MKKFTPFHVWGWYCWDPVPPGMYKNLQLMVFLTYQLVQDFFHQQYHFNGLILFNPPPPRSCCKDAWGLWLGHPRKDQAWNPRRNELLVLPKGKSWKYRREHLKLWNATVKNQLQSRKNTKIPRWVLVESLCWFVEIFTPSYDFHNFSRLFPINRDERYIP